MKKTDLDTVTRRGRPLLAVRVWTIWEEALEELVSTGANEIQKVLDEHVLVLVSHSRDIVHDVSGVVLDEELSTARVEVRIAR